MPSETGVPGPSPLDENKKTAISHQLELQLHHHGYNSEWMVVVFFLPPFTAKNYQVLCLGKEDGVSYNYQA
jgi:hypothetical protein